MKCQYCNGTGEHINDANRMTTCEFCGGTGKIEVTNDEWRRTCSTEEFAKWIYDIRFDFQIPWKNKEIVQWLKEKHHEHMWKK